ncbi:hypothetical protein PL8927_790156 [Planktothrix serta PCC 8927]|uniref:Uncharacterized protein n=1 Tax=Planktothrix serta PCC 8927 TaxID=671068 RepID=A0A7Z9C2N1_9CYAN|nr:hypothetical protein PL8927_790156 [Planktothrix serta PCC 8927]
MLFTNQKNYPLSKTPDNSVRIAQFFRLIPKNWGVNLTPQFLKMKQPCEKPGFCVNLCY